MIEEISIFCSFYFEDYFPRLLNHAPINDDGGPRDTPRCLSIFFHPNREMPLKKSFSDT